MLFRVARNHSILRTTSFRALPLRNTSGVLLKMSEAAKSSVQSPSQDGPSPKRAKTELSSVDKMRDLLKQSTKNIDKPIVWIDCEMTGLDVFNDHIIEICCIITDGNLNIIDEAGYESVVYQPKEVLDAMNEWCINQHTKSGLVAKILATPEQVLAKVESELLEYIQKYIPNQRTAIMAGNSIHMDKFFMMKEFPKVVEHLHYRLIDVSTIMEFGNRHNPQLMKLCPKKTQQHTAKSDILESIAQLQWYRDHYLKSFEDSKDFIKTQEDSSLQKIVDDASKLSEQKMASPNTELKRKV